MTIIHYQTQQYRSVVFFISMVCLIFIISAHSAMATSPVNLGSSENFGILAKTGISTTGTTQISGNIGVSPISATAITGFGLIMNPSNQYSTSSLVVGKVYASDYMTPTPTLLTLAIGDMETAYNEAAGRRPPDASEQYEGILGGKTLPPGLYKWSNNILIPTATDLTLDGQGKGDAVWIFQVAGDLIMNSGSRVNLINGASSRNVYWQIAGPTGVSIGSGSHVEGNILAKKAITMNSGATIQGRALSQTAITLISNRQS